LAKWQGGAENMKLLGKFFGAIGRYMLLMKKVFSRPEKAGIYYRRILVEIEALGINSIPLVAIISIFIGAVIALQMGITLESPFIPKFMIGYATRETMTLEFSSTVIAIILAVVSLSLCIIVYWLGLIFGVSSILAILISRKSLGYFDRISVFSLIIAIFGTIFSLLLLVASFIIKGNPELMQVFTWI
jgi:hypothetical protein